MIQNNHGHWVYTEEECTKIMEERFAKNGYKYLSNKYDEEIDELIKQGKWHKPYPDDCFIDSED